MRSNIHTDLPRHAYAIIANRDKPTLKVLLELIDDPRNDIFLLIDKKTGLDFSKDLNCSKTNLIIIPPEERIDVRWGDMSMVEAELKLFEFIINSGNSYSYIHLLSGQDLPIKSQDEIHDFFQKAVKDSNFIEISEGIENEKNLKSKTDFYYLFTKHQKLLQNNHKSKIQLFIIKCFRHGFLRLQKYMGLKRNWNDLKLARGSQWVSITPEFAKFLVDNKDFILKRFKGVLIPDEIYKPTMIINSRYNSTVCAISRGNSKGIRYVDWMGGNHKGSPKVLNLENWDELKDGPELFARKFSSEENPELIDKVRHRVHSTIFVKSEVAYL